MKYEAMHLSEEELRERGLIQANDQRPCWICNHPTAFIDFCFEQRVCSTECMHIQNKRMSDAR